MKLSVSHRINERRVLAKTFLKRSIKVLERLSVVASPEALSAALCSPSDAGGVASLLSDLAPLGLDLSSVDPLAEAMARGASVKQELLLKAGGGLTSSQVARGLGVTRQAVDKRRGRRALLAVPSGSGEYLYPACQFTGRGVTPGIEETLRAFRIESPWTKLSVLLEPAPALGGKTVLAVLRSGDVKRAVEFVAAVGEQGG